MHNRNPQPIVQRSQQQINSNNRSNSGQQPVPNYGNSNSNYYSNNRQRNKKN